MLDDDALASSYPGTVQAPDAWSAATGQGVTLAEIDTGIDGSRADFNDGAGSPRVIGSAVVNPLATSATDTYGHGTHVAGIIAGDGTRRDATDPLAGQYIGVALRANLVSVKNGIVVVAAAGNRGTDPDAVSHAPGNDPYAITLGATDDRGTVMRADDVVASWSSRGVTQDGFSKPPVTAPGSHIVSTVPPGSAYTQLCRAAWWAVTTFASAARRWRLRWSLGRGADAAGAPGVDARPSSAGCKTAARS